MKTRLIIVCFLALSFSLLSAKPSDYSFSFKDDFSIEITKNEKFKLHLVGHKDEVLAAAYDPIRNQIVSYSKDNTINIWDSRKGRLLKSFNTTLRASPISAHIDANNYEIVINTSSQRFLVPLASSDVRHRTHYVTEDQIDICGLIELALPLFIYSRL
ncbi:MAG: hypothetical protein KC505_09000 [Myxococcales bacterium]|nr:hypothetical protein [Myxococcales bacterium]USN50112.1 MAG: hypothetical protein H6731_07520 [Myxococcales bacterium]